MRFLSRLHGLAALVTAVALLNCTTNPFTGERQQTKTAVGAELGALAGAGVGLIAGGDAKSALIGAGIGALAGGAVGHYMDKQEEKLRVQLAGTGVSVTRRGDDLILNMPGDVTFDTDRADIKPAFFDVLHSVALVLDEFDKTSIHVTGFTDSTGSFEHNFDLSQRRAEVVGKYLGAQGIHPARIFTQGMGPKHPVATNDTAEGRAMNRRVELTLVPHT